MSCWVFCSTPPGSYSVPVAFMGAPTIGIERLKSGKEGQFALEAMTKLFSIGRVSESGKLSNVGKED